MKQKSDVWTLQEIRRFDDAADAENKTHGI
jgi:hypothetical protein